MESRHQRHQLAPRPRLVDGAAVPLFERFLEEVDDRRIVEPYRLQSLPLLLESIQQQIDHLLNTRLPPRQPPRRSWDPISEPQTVLDYGLPALSPLNSGSLSDATLLRDTILAKIAAFEPRLQNPALILRQDPEDPTAMIGTLQGSVTLDRVTQPVSFPVIFFHHGESATISPGESD
jgi:type VI secretion system lysozyme-like protein